MSALTRQVGGSHYKGMGIQPTVYAMVNGYDGCCYCIAKYLMRVKGDRVEDLEKAKHYAQMRLEISWPCAYTAQVITVDELVTQNGYDPQGWLARALKALAEFQWRTTMVGVYPAYVSLLEAIDEMILAAKSRVETTSFDSPSRQFADTSFNVDNDRRVNVIGQNGNDGEHYVKR